MRELTSYCSLSRARFLPMYFCAELTLCFEVNGGLSSQDYSGTLNIGCSLGVKTSISGASRVQSITTCRLRWPEGGLWFSGQTGPLESSARNWYSTVYTPSNRRPTQWLHLQCQDCCNAVSQFHHLIRCQTGLRSRPGSVLPCSWLDHGTCCLYRRLLTGQWLFHGSGLRRWRCPSGSRRRRPSYRSGHFGDNSIKTWSTCVLAEDKNPEPGCRWF